MKLLQWYTTIIKSAKTVHCVQLRPWHHRGSRIIEVSLVSLTLAVYWYRSDATDSHHKAARYLRKFFATNFYASSREFLYELAQNRAAFYYVQ